jgi:hypothetical protein
MQRPFVALSQLRQLLPHDVLERRAVDRRKVDNHNIDVAVNELVDPLQATVTNRVLKRQFELLVGKGALPQALLGNCLDVAVQETRSCMANMSCQHTSANSGEGHPSHAPQIPTHDGICHQHLIF